MNRTQGYLSPGFHDLNGDGTADALSFVWRGRHTLFIAESGRLPWPRRTEGRDWSAYFDRAFRVAAKGENPWSRLRAHWGSYTLLVDLSGCGDFGSRSAYCYRAIDWNGDGAPEAEYYHLFPGSEQYPYSNKLHISLDGSRQMSYLDFGTLTYPDEQRYGRGFAYKMNVQTSGFFLNSYSADPRLSWEAPIAWYDFDEDGCPEFVMRVADTLHNRAYHNGSLSPCHSTYSGLVSEFELAYELNGNTGIDRRHSLDLQLTFYNYEKPTLDLAAYEDEVPALAPLAGSETFHGEMAATRLQTKRCYLPYLDGCRIGAEHGGWQGVFLQMDEDDDDCRWEEMFSAHEDPVEHASRGWGVCADKIGDRTERDADYKGRGLLYIGSFDGRIHLYHAEEAVWDVDYLGLYKGSIDHASTREGPCPPEGLRYPRVRYQDTDGDGFIDTITWMTVSFLHEDTDFTIDKTIRLARYAPDGQLPRPALFDPRADTPLCGWNLREWDGQPLSRQTWEASPAMAYHSRMKQYYRKVCGEMWRGAQMLYQTAKCFGLNTSEHLDAELRTHYTRKELLRLREYGVPPGYSRHLLGRDLREQYHNGFWLREKVFADLCNAPQLDPFRLEQLYYTGQYDTLCAYIRQCCSHRTGGQS